MNAFRFKPYLIRLYLAAFILFLINKAALRPFVLEHEFSPILTIIVLSIPNTFEAIIGLSNVAGLLMIAKRYFSPRFDRVPDRVLYLLATALAGTYVLTQEFNLHALGGRNVYDPYDVIASLIGLVGMFLLFWRYGVLEQNS